MWKTLNIVLEGQRKKSSQAAVSDKQSHEIYIWYNKIFWKVEVQLNLVLGLSEMEWKWNYNWKKALTYRHCIFWMEKCHKIQTFKVCLTFFVYPFHWRSWKKYFSEILFSSFSVNHLLGFGGYNLLLYLQWIIA